jgi:hypothetical protein
MKKVISFSLWGDNFRYIGGALQNASLARIFYPDWICRFYVGGSTDPQFFEKIKKYDNVEIVVMPEAGNWTGMFWRFFAASDLSVDVMVSRDADSRLGFREKHATDEWLKSNKQFHIMRDHPNHGVPILGGMWGVKGRLLSDMQELSKNYKPGNFWQTDQIFLSKLVYSKVKDTALVHDEFFEKRPFPEASRPRNRNHFVGQAYDGSGFVLDTPEYGIQSYKDYLNEQGIDWRFEE